jgi:hypothetical protein
MLDQKIKTSLVDKLLVQYKNYMDIFSQIKDVKFEILKSSDEEKVKLENKLSVLNTILSRLSDEMTFPSPSIWMMYKYNTYKGTDKEIKTVKDFTDHCSPEGYICTRRYKFFVNYFDMSKYTNDQDLEIVFNSKDLHDLECDILFINKWIEKEYNIENNKISKW